MSQYPGNLNNSVSFGAQLLTKLRERENTTNRVVELIHREQCWCIESLLNSRNSQPGKRERLSGKEFQAFRIMQQAQCVRCLGAVEGLSNSIRDQKEARFPLWPVHVQDQ